MPFSENFLIVDNEQLRIPQREAWNSINNYFQDQSFEREASIVLPVGCGKSGLITIAPFALNSSRVLVIAPGTRIRDQLWDDFRADSNSNFYQNRGILSDEMEFPEVVRIASGRVNLDDINHSDVCITNIQQIAGDENRWLDQVPTDFFDLILVDEAHHNTANSWQQVKQRFPEAQIINFSATPMRADGNLMEGSIIYSFPILRAIELGYVKRLRAKMLRPTELRYIDRNSGQEKIIGPDEVRELGETDSEFRRGIVMSDETLNSIVTQSIDELRRLRAETGEQKLKIIASALNLDHCIQIKEAFRSFGLRADYVHSRESSNVNERVFQQLENHELDVIIQSRMLGEGFNHPYLAVAMVGSIFSNLSPFVQFVGRIMRSLVQNQPGHLLNQGVVVFHIGANVANRWDDFREFSEADQQFFAQLLPEAEEVEFSGNSDTSFSTIRNLSPVEIIEEYNVRASDLPPIGDPEAAELLQQLSQLGITPEQAAQELRRLRTTRQSRREARRTSLNDRIQNEVGGIVNRLSINPGGRNLDPQHRRTNYPWLISELNHRINQFVDGGVGNRQNFTLEQLNSAHDGLPNIITQIEGELASATP